MKRLAEVKKRGLFSVWDLPVYALIALLAAVLFLVFVFGASDKEAAGVRVAVNGETVYTYVFGKGGEVSSGWEERVSETSDGALVTVTVFTDAQKTQYNIIVIDEDAGTAAMADANCGYRKDCTHMEAVSTESDVIVCVPHSLQILALTEDLYHPSIG